MNWPLINKSTPPKEEEERNIFINKSSFGVVDVVCITQINPLFCYVTPFRNYNTVRSINL